MLRQKKRERVEMQGPAWTLKKKNRVNTSVERKGKKSFGS